MLQHTVTDTLTAKSLTHNYFLRLYLQSRIAELKDVHVGEVFKEDFYPKNCMIMPWH